MESHRPRDRCRRSISRFLSSASRSNSPVAPAYEVSNPQLLLSPKRQRPVHSNNIRSSKAGSKSNPRYFERRFKRARTSSSSSGANALNIGAFRGSSQQDEVCHSRSRDLGRSFAHLEPTERVESSKLDANSSSLKFSPSSGCSSRQPRPSRARSIIHVAQAGTSSDSYPASDRESDDSNAADSDYVPRFKGALPLPVGWVSKTCAFCFLLSD